MLIPDGDFSLRNPWVTGIIFLMTFLLVSFRRLSILPIGRTSGALLGGVLMVLSGVMKPEEAYRLVNWDTICLLLGMMIIAEYMKEAGLFERMVGLFQKIRSPFGLITITSFFSAFLSAFLVNDTICFVMTPLVLGICRTRKLDPFPFLIAVATSSNIGSALTLTGNPQNMIVGTISHIEYGKFIRHLFPVVFSNFLINLFLIWLFYRSRLKPFPMQESSSPSIQSHEISRGKCSPLISLGALGISCIGFFVGYSMAFSALTGAIVAITFHREDPRERFKRLEWQLLMFFAALFVVIGGLKVSGLADSGVKWALSYLVGDLNSQAWIFSGVTLIGSNIFSNVPFVLIASQSVPHLPNPEMFWCLLAYVSTVAGNFTLFGSIANLIVAESSRDVCELGFFEYAKFGIPSTLLTLIAGICIFLFTW